MTNTEGSKAIVTQDTIDAAHEIKAKYPDMTAKDVAQMLFGMGKTRKVPGRSTVAFMLRFSSIEEYREYMKKYNKSDVNDAEKLPDKNDEPVQEQIQIDMHEEENAVNDTEKETTATCADLGLIVGQITDMQTCVINDMNRLLTVPGNGKYPDLTVGEKMNVLCSYIGKTYNSIGGNAEKLNEMLQTIEQRLSMMQTVQEETNKILKKLVALWDGSRYEQEAI